MKNIKIHAPNAERRVLAAIICNGAKFDLAIGRGIRETSFFLPEHRRIFAAMAAISTEGYKIDLVTLGERLPDDMELLAQIEGSFVTDVNFLDWLDLLRNKEAARFIAEESERLTTEISDGIKTSEAVAKLATMEGEARQMMAGKHFPSLEETAEILRKRMVEALPLVIPFFPSETVGGNRVQLHPGEMMVIGGRTGLGKTAFACGGALEQLRAGLVVGYFCTESTSADILARMAAQYSGVPHFEAQRRRRNPELVAQFAAGIEEISRKFSTRLHIHGCETGIITPEIIRGRCRDVLLKSGKLDVIYIDFLQGVKAPLSMSARPFVEQMNYNIQCLHGMFSEFNSAGVILSQFNRASQSDRAGGLPDITWLKDSSMIEQLAHTVAFLHRDDCAASDAPTLFYSRKTRNQMPFYGGFNLSWNGTGYASEPLYDSGAIPSVH